jgi:hypothetical protein
MKDLPHPGIAMGSGKAHMAMEASEPKQYVIFVFDAKAQILLPYPNFKWAPSYKSFDQGEPWRK